MSDTHMQHRGIAYKYPDAFPSGDVLIHCGDWSGYGELSELIDFTRWIERLDYSEKIVVAGNHDLWTESNQEETRKILLKSDITYLQDESYVLKNGMLLYGSPWTPAFMNWGFMKDQHELVEVWKKVSDTVDILVTHGPPYQIMDRVFRGVNIGDRALRDRIEELENLKYHFFGHSHEGYGHTEYTTHKGNSIQMYNIAVVDINMVLVRSPIHLEVE